MFRDKTQKEDWAELMLAADTADHAPVCENYPDAFFPEKGSSQHSPEIVWAKETCNACPIIAECGIYALKYERFGVWGGMTAEERRLKRSKLRLSPLIA